MQLIKEREIPEIVEEDEDESYNKKLKGAEQR
jgi:hypothetical protein